MSESGLRDRRVVITGAARGIGALLARRLHERGARVALLGIEPELLEATASECGGAPWFECDVADRSQVDAAVTAAVERLGGAALERGRSVSNRVGCPCAASSAPQFSRSLKLIIEFVR